MTIKAALILAGGIVLAALIYVWGTETEYEQCVDTLMESGNVSVSSAGSQCAIWMGGNHAR